MGGVAARGNWQAPEGEGDFFLLVGTIQDKTRQDRTRQVIIEASVSNNLIDPIFLGNTKMSDSKSLDTISLFRGVAIAIHSGVSAVDVVNGSASVLREAKIVFGKSVKTCQFRLQFADAMKAAFKGKTAKTYSNYMTSFVVAVNEGKPFSLSSSKSSAKGGSKGKTKTEAIDKVIARVFSHPEFKTWCEKIEASFQDAEADTLEGCVRSYLEAEGYEITE